MNGKNRKIIYNNALILSCTIWCNVFILIVENGDTIDVYRESLHLISKLKLIYYIDARNTGHAVNHWTHLFRACQVYRWRCCDRWRTITVFIPQREEAAEITCFRLEWLYTEKRFILSINFTKKYTKCSTIM